MIEILFEANMNIEFIDGIKRQIDPNFYFEQLIILLSSQICTDDSLQQGSQGVIYNSL